MNEIEQNKHRMELIKMARELLNEAYINRRAEDHNRWLAESDVMWRTKRMKLPYPPFATYPTDEEIVAKATALYNFVNSPQPTTPLPVLDPVVPPQATIITPTPGESPWDTRPIHDDTPSYDLSEKEQVANISEHSAELSSMTPNLDATTYSNSAPDQIYHSTPGLQNLLPGWVRRSNTA